MVITQQSMRTWFADRLGRTSDRGASLVEYALLVALIALICFAAVGFLGEETSSQFTDVGQSFTDIRAN